MKKVGIYSGTFDPVHEGHLAFARAALEKQNLDKVFFLVEPRPRRKQGVKAFEHRSAMVRLATAKEPKFGNIILQQQRFTSTETLPVLRRRFRGAKLYMLMGDDWLAHFGSWPQVDQLVNGVEFIIGLKQQSKETVEHQIEALRQTKGLDMRYQLLSVDLPSYSSSKIKRSLRAGHTPQGLPASVLEYIIREGLYAPSISDPK